MLILAFIELNSIENNSEMFHTVTFDNLKIKIKEHFRSSDCGFESRCSQYRPLCQFKAIV